MVRVNGPAFSLEASGQLAGAIVFSKWKGRPYIRELVKPSNPRSGPQVGIRAMLRFLTQNWQYVSSVNQATWKDRADAKVISNFNAYVGYNVYRWRDFLAPTQHDPEAATDTPPTLGTLAAAAGVRSITVTQPITTAADGWGVCFFRSLTGTFTSTFDKLRYVGRIVGTADVVFVDSPLDPGTYYYEVRSITQDGQLSAASSEVSDTVT